MRALEFITGHVIYNLPYMYLQIPTENHPNALNLMNVRQADFLPHFSVQFIIKSG